ncbi:MAG: GIY-YIG nuclease family protein [Myxococcaceae bacterium]|nr:GIY-YIG nuclease family protein [Myxococcaceae bacterium]
MPWYVYMVRCRDGSLYTGITTDLARRVAAHSNGTGARYTRSRRPVTLVYSRRARDKASALKTEYRLKQLSRSEKLALTTTTARQRAVRRRAT